MSDDAGPGDAVRARAIVAAHGDLAEGLTSAVAAVAGVEGAFVALSNRGLDRGALESLLRDTMERTGARVIFTDLAGGSWTLAARRLQREYTDLYVVTGTSLPALLDFAFSSGDPAMAARQAVERGRSALVGAAAPVATSGS